MTAVKRVGLALVAAALLTSVITAPQVVADPAPAVEKVLFVGNNWDGTVDVISQGANLEQRKRINAVPDLAERMAELYPDPLRFVAFLAVRYVIGEGHDQLVDDMYTTQDGTTLVVSRPSLADVVGIDLASNTVQWRFPVAGIRADHMGVSPDGQTVAVSASTANVVHLLNINTGAEIATVPTGDSPHENVFSRDGSKMSNASIGRVYLPFDIPWLDFLKGDRPLEIIDTHTHEVIKKVYLDQKLAEAGYPGMSPSVRPMTFSPDERFVYFQVSYFHGFVEYDLEQDKVTRVAALPVANPAQPREQYVLNSAHHGIAMNPEGTKVCVAGTMSDYAMVVPRDTLEPGAEVRAGTKPYWVTPSADGQHCFVSWAGTNTISAISYATGELVKTIDVGLHPQRMRVGNVRSDWLSSPSPVT